MKVLDILSMIGALVMAAAPVAVAGAATAAPAKIASTLNVPAATSSMLR